MTLCSCGRLTSTCDKNDETRAAHDRLVMQRFVDGAERSSPLMRLGIAFGVRDVLIKRGLMRAGEVLTDEQLVERATRIVGTARCAS